MTNPTLYTFELDEDCYRARLLLSLLQVPYTRVAVDMVPGREHLAPHMLALNPHGTLPILVDGDLTLIDMTEILRHIVERFRLAGQAIAFELSVDAPVRTWLDFAARDLQSARQARLAALLGLPSDLAALTYASAKTLRTMDDAMTHRHFEGCDWFVGETVTLADVALYPSFALSRDYGVEHAEFPALRRWARRVRALPGFITMPGIPDYA